MDVDQLYRTKHHNYDSLDIAKRPAIIAVHRHLTDVKFLRQILDMWKSEPEEQPYPNYVYRPNENKTKDDDESRQKIIPLLFLIQMILMILRILPLQIIFLHLHIDIPNLKIPLLKSHFTDNPEEFGNPPDQIRENELNIIHQQQYDN
ncbi:hypothetical protein Glove_221g56 [Diversispora epigaea]|uniref:Uncharacterized protein n=1 Tax=Diversispora epigaea TaxID=1348612 RepID=A0A397IIC0_9GLOM|nr:hypothetical protein Glove_221g56 [Diversispora epigaea]